MGFFSLESERLVLRPFNVADSGEYFRITQDDKIRRYLPYACPRSIEEAKEDIKNYYSKGDFKHDIYLVIENKDTHIMIGALIITQNCNLKYDMSLLIAKQHRHKGYMTEALNTLIDYMPKESTLLFLIEDTNFASYNCVSKLKNVKNITVSYNLKHNLKHIIAFELIV